MSDRDKLYLARSNRGQHTVVTAIGAVTEATVINLRTVMWQAIARYGPRLVLDLSGVDRLDETGAALRRLGERAGLLGAADLRLLGPPPGLADQP